MQKPESRRRHQASPASPCRLSMKDSAAASDCQHFAAQELLLAPARTQTFELNEDKTHGNGQCSANRRQDGMPTSSNFLAGWREEGQSCRGTTLKTLSLFRAAIAAEDELELWPARGPAQCSEAGLATRPSVGPRTKHSLPSCDCNDEFRHLLRQSVPA